MNLIKKFTTPTFAQLMDNFANLEVSLKLHSEKTTERANVAAANADAYAKEAQDLRTEAAKASKLADKVRLLTQ